MLSGAQQLRSPKKSGQVRPKTGASTLHLPGNRWSLGFPGGFRIQKDDIVAPF